jgi:hypothetical protein
VLAKSEKNPKALERWNIRKQHGDTQLQQINDFIFYRDEESLAALGLTATERIGAGSNGLVWRGLVFFFVP